MPTEYQRNGGHSSVMPAQVCRRCSGEQYNQQQEETTELAAFAL
ncbi:hypothetical protein [Escherichia coli]